MPYDGRYGRVARAVRKKRAMNRFGVGRKPGTEFDKGGGAQRLPSGRGIPPTTKGDSTSGEPQDKKAARMRPTSMKDHAISKGRRDATAPTDKVSTGAPSPKLRAQEGHPVKAGATKGAGGYRSFNAIIKGNRLGARLPPKKGHPKNMKPTPKR